MMVTPLRCVIDASVGIKRVITEPDSAQAWALFDHLVQDPAARFSVPDFFFLECANILWKLVKKAALTVAEAGTSLGVLRALRLDVVPVVSLVDDALALSASFDISAYDAAYVAAAARESVPLITADARLVSKLAATAYPIHLLSALTIPPPAPPGP